MKKLYRILLSLLTILLGIGLSFNAYAKETIDEDAKGSVIVTKYANVSSTKEATGLKEDIEGTPIKNVQYTLYPVMNAKDTIKYYNGKNKDSIEVDDFISDGKIIESKVISDKGYSTQKLTTDKNGTCSFTDLPVGMYVLIETYRPAKVAESSTPCLISIPMSSEKNSWNYDVYVYPKSEILDDELQLKIIKYGNGFKDEDGSVVLKGVTFSLLKKGSLEDWSDAIEITAQATEDGDNTGKALNLVTDENGTIELSGLNDGNYRLTEKDLGTNTEYIIEATTYDFAIKNSQVTFADDFESTHSNAIKDSSVPYVNVNGNELSIVNYKPTLEKEVDTEDTIFSPGDIVNYIVYTEIPNNISSYDSFVFEDTPEDLVFNDFDGVYDEDENLISSDLYTFEAGEDTDGFILSFRNFSAWKEYAGQTITIRYTNMVTGTDVTGMNNSIELEYSDSDSSSKKEKKDQKKDVVIHTLSFEIQKTFEGMTSGDKSGTEFEIYKDSVDSNNLMHFTYKENEETGKKEYAVDPIGETTTVVTNADGLIDIVGLSNATYYIKETKSISGYTKLDEPAKVVIDVNMDNDGNITTNSNNTAILKDNGLYCEIVNKKTSDDSDKTDDSSSSGKSSTKLPNTQGISFIIVSIIGIVILFIGFTYLNVNHKSKEEE